MWVWRFRRDARHSCSLSVLHVLGNTHQDKFIADRLISRNSFRAIMRSRFLPEPFWIWPRTRHQAKPSRRRSDFPTWSWASITGSTTYPSAVQSSPLGMFQNNSPCLENEHISTSLFVKVLDSTGPKLLISLYQAVEDTRLAHLDFLPEISKAMLVEGDLLEVELSDREFASATWDPFKHLLSQIGGSIAMNTPIVHWICNLTSTAMSTATANCAKPAPWSWSRITTRRSTLWTSTVCFWNVLLRMCFERRGFLQCYDIPQAVFNALLKKRRSFWLQWAAQGSRETQIIVVLLTRYSSPWPQTLVLSRKHSVTVVATL